MVTTQDLETKTAKEIITETEAVDTVIDALIQEILALRARVEALENQ